MPFVVALQMKVNPFIKGPFHKSVTEGYILHEEVIFTIYGHVTQGEESLRLILKLDGGRV